MKGVVMGTATVEERLAEMRRQIEQLEAKGRSSTGEAKARIQPHLDALREQETAAHAAVAKGSDSAEEKLEQLKTRLDIAQHSLAADVAENREQFGDAVEAELHSWDAYLERLQVAAATKAWTARLQTETAIGDLRERRIAVAQRLGQVHDDSEAAWSEQKERIVAARDELQRKADALSAKVD
jgi:hypothetical protein